MSTPENYLECVQGSELWKRLRCGYITASRLWDVIEMNAKHTEYKMPHFNYRAELVCERLTGIPYDRFVTKEMQWGLDHEAEARAAYELHAGELVDTCGFVLHPTVPMFGASPDGLVSDDGLIQIKCPTSKTHLEWLSTQTVPYEYLAQMLAEMAVTGREWCDFVSYDPRFPAPCQLYVKRCVRDDRNDKIIAQLERDVANFNKEIDDLIASLPQPGPAPVVDLLDHNDEEEREF